MHELYQHHPGKYWLSMMQEVGEESPSQHFEKSFLYVTGSADYVIWNTFCPEASSFCWNWEILRKCNETSASDFKNRPEETLFFFFLQMPPGAQYISNESLFSVVLKYISMNSPKKKTNMTWIMTPVHYTVNWSVMQWHTNKQQLN